MNPNAGPSQAMATSDGDKEETEKRLLERVERLFPPGTMQASSSSSRPLVPSTGEVSPFRLVEEAPSQCSSWNRAEMFKRLGSFKSMNWFGKPESAGPIACARRGWSSRSPDMIGCDFCGSCLCFTIPNDWPKQQVEKAALEFSEKLASGHKPLCPWKDSACPENFAHFPPSTVSALVQGYTQRMTAMKELAALPKLASEAVQTIRNTKSAQAEFLLLPISDESRLEKLDGPRKESVNQLCHRYESYQQALKLISLCGWELRVLNYAVEGQKLASDPHEQSDPHEHGPRVSLHPNDKPSKSIDPTSAVLDCKLCGVSVGLWNFETVSRVTESLTELLARVTTAEEKPVVVEPEKVASPVASPEIIQEKPKEVAEGMDLYLTIAGGPRPSRLPAVYPAYIPIPGLIGREHVEQPEQNGDKKKKRVRTDEEQVHRNKLQKVTGGGCSSVEAVETSHQNKHENSAESVDCTPREGDVRRQAQQDIVCRLASYRMENSSSGTASREFDPILQHRYFCPWISANRGTGCGWHLTIDALFARKNGSDEPAVATSTWKTTTSAQFETLRSLS